MQKKYAGLIILLIAFGWLALPEASAATVPWTETVNHDRVTAPTMNILRVDDDSGAGAGANGSSWALAYPTLQDALAAASSGDEIWVAKGVYYPDEGGAATNNNEASTFQLKTGVAIYGGFVGNDTETLRSQRDWQANITVLSGDIDHESNADSNKDTNGIIPAISDIVGSNAYHVVTGSGTNNTALLDGFTINAGQANGTFASPCGPVCGGGIYNDAGSPTLTNVTVTANSAQAGGGIYNTSSNPTLINVTLTANSAQAGGGIYNLFSNPTLTNVTLTANSATDGGGIYNDFLSNPTLTNVTLTANSAQVGGGIYNSSSSEPTLTNVTLTANSANRGGGISNFASNPTLTNVTLTANSANNNGGGIYNDSSNPTLTNVIIWNNQANGATNTTSASISNVSSTPSISHSLIANSGGSGAWVNALGADGGNNIDVDPMFVQDGNLSTTPPTEGDYRLQLGSPAIDAGDNAAVTTATDLAGNPRIQSIVVDMGAYEADAPQIELLGSDITITDGVTTTNIADGTDFGTVLVGEPVSQTFTISNTGSTALALSLPMTLSNSTHFAITTLPATTIPVSGSTSFAVTFTPNSTDTFTSTIEIANNDPDRNPFDFVVGGTGGVPEIDVQGAGVSIASGDTSPSTLDDTEFGDVLVGETMTHTFTISNTGSYSLTLDGNVTLSDGTHFSISSQPSSPIAAGSASTFEITFNPSATGTQTTTVSIKSDDSDESTYTFDVQGTGIAPEIDVRGKNVSISSGDTTPRTQDDTDFGNLLVNSSMTHTFTISNTGTSPLNLNGLLTLSDGTHFSISSQPSATIAAAGTSSFVVQFAPTATGVQTTTVSISNDDSDENPYTFDVQGTGIAPEIDVRGKNVSISSGDTTPRTQDDTDFGNLLVNSSMTHTFTISNTGTSPLNLNGLLTLSDGTHFSISSQPTSPIAAGSASTFEITFNPSTTGTQTATVSIKSDDSDESTYTFDVGGTGIAPEIDVRGQNVSISSGDTTPRTQDDTDFGNLLVNSSMTHTFTISNTGTSPLNLNGLLTLSDGTHFSISSQPASPIAAGSASTFEITFNPSATGTQNTTVSIKSDDSDESTYTFVLGGTGIAPEIDVRGKNVSISSGDTTPRTQDDTDFGNLLVNSSMTHTFTISNTGTSPLNLNGGVTLSDGTHFSVSSQPTSPIAANSASTFEITFNPSTTGIQNTTVSIKSDDSDESTYTFDVQGTGIAPEIDVRGKNVSISSGDTTPRTQDDTDFGNLLVNSSMTHTFTISNTGTSPLNLNGGVTLSDGTHFSISSQPTSPIAANSASTFEITFNPSATGTQTATVSIKSDDSDESTYTFDVGGTGIAPEIDVRGQNVSISSGDTTPRTQDDTDFGNLLVNSSMTHTFTISNTGTSPLNLNGGVTLSDGTHFSISSQPASPIAAGSASTFEITFNPSTTGTQTATVSIKSDDSDESTYTFDVGGTGIAPEIDVRGQNVSISSGDTTPRTQDDTDFGNLIVNSSMTHTFTISNTGTSPLNLSLPITLSDSTHFTITSQPNSPIAVAGTSSFVVQFAPTATGVQTATVSINNDDSDSNPYTFDISGNGITPGISVLGLGVTIPNGDTTPDVNDDTDFGDLLVNSSTTHTFTISNTGTSSLNLSLPITLSDSTHFTITSQPSSPIAVAGTSSFVVQFAPTATGVQTATVSINNDDTDSNPYTFVIGGTGDDSDGVAKSEEDNVPGLNGSATGDGNGDGVPDSEQEHVASLRGSTNEYVTFATDSGKKLIDVTPTNQPASAPSSVQFPYGHFSFAVSGLSTGEAFTVELILHGNQSAPTTFWKYGPTNDNNMPHWYEFSYDGTTGAQISGNLITLHFVDGQRGDSDLTANGQLTDPGAPAINPSSPPPSVNQPPQLDQPIPDIIVNEGAVDQPLSLLDYFSDPEGDLLFFTIIGNSNPQVVPSANIGLRVDQSLTLQFGSPGTTEITILAEEDVHHKTFQGSFTVTVLEQPTPTPTITPTLSISDTTISESSTPATFVVTLSPSSTQPVTVEYATIEGSATADDYTPISGTLTLPAGDITGTISVPIEGDDTPEADESFILRLSNATNAIIADDEAIGTILDDDQEATSITLASFSARDDAPSTDSGRVKWWIGLLLVCGAVVWRQWKMK